MSKYFERIKHFYDMGLWTAEQVEQAVEKGLITEEEKNIILGANNDTK